MKVWIAYAKNENEKRLEMRRFFVQFVIWGRKKHYLLLFVSAVRAFQRVVS